MSGTVVINPGAGLWGEMRTGDIDTRSISFAADLAQISDTIASVSAINITRLDGQAMTANDLSAARAPIVNTAALTGAGGATYPISTVATVWLNAGTAGGDYDVEVIVLTVGGRTIGRDTVITVSTSVG